MYVDKWHSYIQIKVVVSQNLQSSSILEIIVFIFSKLKPFSIFNYDYVITACILWICKYIKLLSSYYSRTFSSFSIILW